MIFSFINKLLRRQHNITTKKVEQNPQGINLNCAKHYATLTFQLIKNGLIMTAASISQQIKPLLESASRLYQIPSLSVGITTAKQTHYLAFNTPIKNEKNNVDENTLFRVGSISKGFIALAINQLVKEKNASLMDPLSVFLPQKIIKNIDPRITLQHLITHTAGFAPFGASLQGFLGLPIKLAHLPTNAAPGEKFQYHNGTYGLLAKVIETLSGMPWSHFLQKKIFSPLGMNNTHFTKPTGHLASPYLEIAGENQRLTNEPFADTLLPASGLFSTSADLAKFMRSLINNPPLEKNNTTPVSLMTPQNSDFPHRRQYNAGHFILHLKNPAITLHHYLGGLPGYSALVCHIPTLNTGITLLANKMNLATVFEFLGAEFAALAHGDQPSNGLSQLKTRDEKAKQRLSERLNYRKSTHAPDTQTTRNLNILDKRYGHLHLHIDQSMAYLHFLDVDKKYPLSYDLDNAIWVLEQTASFKPEAFLSVFPRIEIQPHNDTFSLKVYQSDKKGGIFLQENHLSEVQQ
jgi:CubicO group peptidase (beta-lactamase class C family)